MDILDHDLETVEAAGLRNLDLVREALQQILVHNAIGGSKEGQDVRDEVALIVRQLVLPIVHVLGEINFLSGPEGGLSLLVHLPHLVELDGEEHKAARVGAQDGLVLLGDLHLAQLQGETGLDLLVGGLKGLGDGCGGGVHLGNGEGRGVVNVFAWSVCVGVGKCGEDERAREKKRRVFLLLIEKRERKRHKLKNRPEFLYGFDPGRVLWLNQNKCFRKTRCAISGTTKHHTDTSVHM